MATGSAARGASATKKDDDGVLLLVAPNEHKVRIETGYGAGGFLTDAMSGLIIREASCRNSSRAAIMAAGSTPGPTRSSSR